MSHTNVLVAPDIDGFEVGVLLAGLDEPPAVVHVSRHDRMELEPFVPTSDASGFVPKAELSREALPPLVRWDRPRST